MLFYYWVCVVDSDTTLSQQRVETMCLLGTLNVLPFDKQISVYSKVQNPSAQMFKCATT